MKKTGRNAPCPCGSGKKYKLCCLKQGKSEPPTPLPPPPPMRGVLFEDDIDRDSNRVVRLLKAGKIEKAEKAAALLFEKYPEMPDGHERTAQVLEAKGERKGAAEHYKKAAEMLHASDPVHSQESVDFLLEKAREMEADAPASE